MIREMRVRRTALAEATLSARDAALAPGSVRFAIDSFALTANNVTYAAHGVDMRYWDFFPAGADHGVVPVWGFAHAVESTVDGIEAGDRFYGYWPFADGATLMPVKVSPRGFVDGVAHRQGLAAVYNGYARVTEAMADTSVYALFRPLFLTSFLLDAAFAGVAPTLLITSASAKTALGLAQLARARGDARIVGLTSPRNRDFVAATGYYDTVAIYDEAATLAADGAVACADFAGNGAVRAALHTRFGASVVKSLVIGDTHWDASGVARDLPGARPEGFFAPAVLHEQIAAHGQAAFDARVEAAWTAFVKSTAGWLKIVEIGGLDAATAMWTRLAEGDVDPAVGLIVRPGGGAWSQGA